MLYIIDKLKERLILVLFLFIFLSIFILNDYFLFNYKSETSEILNTNTNKNDVFKLF